MSGMKRLGGLAVAAALLLVPAVAQADQGSSQVQLYAQANAWAQYLADRGDPIYSFNADPNTMWWDPNAGAWGAHLYVHSFSRTTSQEIVDHWDCLAMPGWNYCEGRGVTVNGRFYP